MATFTTANQVRLMMKMKLSQYAWYSSSVIVTELDGYGVIIGVKRIDNQIRKIISPVINGVSIKTEVE